MIINNSCSCSWVLFGQEKGRKRVFALRWLSVFSLPATSAGWLADTILPHNSCILASMLGVAIQTQSTYFWFCNSDQQVAAPLTACQWHQTSASGVALSSVHHLNIVGMPKHFSHSVSHRLLWTNSRARSMFSLLCAAGSGYESFTPTFLVQWQSKI